MINLNIIVIVIVLIFIPTIALSEISSKEFAKCAAIEGDLERLECYDALAKTNKLDKPNIKPTQNKGNGKWLVESSINPVDDSRKVILYLEADSGASQWGNKIFLIVRCQSNKTEMFIKWHDYLGSDVYVLTRIGSEKAETKEWNISTDSQGSFYPYKTISFLKRMMKANKLLAQVTPYNENPVTAIFNTTGMSNAIKPLRETCGW